MNESMAILMGFCVFAVVFCKLALFRFCSESFEFDSVFENKASSADSNKNWVTKLLIQMSTKSLSTYDFR